MKKKILTLTTMIACIVMVALFCGPAAAVVTGVCSNCHTMHNSEDGGSMNFDESTTTPTAILLRGDCIGCHSDATASTHSGAPVVYNTSSVAYGYNAEGLAAGNFINCDVTGERHLGHNVTMTGNVADSLTAPPGFIDIGSAGKPSSYTYGSSTQWGPSSWNSNTNPVTCAGEYGCHGDRGTDKTDWTGINGAHHASDATIDGSTVAQSYRFLAGIVGVEDADWELTQSATDHNGYKGATASTAGLDNTISYLCGECHGNFHYNADLGGTGQVGSSSSWLRHPTDITMEASGSSPFTTDYTAYSVETPVAFASPSTTSSSMTDATVMCLSCHRAHASPHTDILRFAYSDITAGDSTNDGGCERCHERQR